MQPRAIRTIEALLDKGVSIPNPLSLDIGPEVDVDRISADGVTIHPGCRIRGGRTVISAGVTLGSEGPVTIEDCRLGPHVSLKGGYAANAVFLQRLLGLYRRPNKQQRVWRMAGPAGLGNQQIQAEGRQIVRERVHLRVARLIQHLRVGVA